MRRVKRRLQTMLEGEPAAVIEETAGAAAEVRGGG